MPAYLVLESVLPPYTRFVLNEDECTIGRSSQCALQVSDTSVSRRHARIRRDGTDFRIEDLESSNGTFLGSRRIQAEAIHDGQTISFGKAAYRVRIRAAGAPDLGEENTSLGSSKDAGAAAPTVTLSPSQKLVLDQLLTGMGDKDIARTIGLSRHTVHTHVKAIFKRFHVHSRAELLSQHIGKNQTTDLPMSARAIDDPGAKLV
jgi:DNA-binding CsgD family transcriptional regulator